MDLRDVLTRKRDEIAKIAAIHGARNIRVFGSVARGEADEKSDIDFLVLLRWNRAGVFWILAACSWTCRKSSGVMSMW